MALRQSLGGLLLKQLGNNGHLDILVGIPSYKEADSIGFVTEQIDKGLHKYFPSKKALILNADNSSPDQTRQVFLHTETKTPKSYISTPPKIRGKGNNCFNIFIKAKLSRARAVLMVDADLKSITPAWVKLMLEPIFKKNFDYVTPVYLRHEYDGTLTNNFCYPLLYGLLGHDLRQPIAGDFAMSGSLAQYFLIQKWTSSVKNYGVDIFMTMAALFGGFKHAQVTLGAKIHKPSAPKLGQMFTEVISTLFSYLANNKEVWLKTKKGIHQPRRFGRAVKNPPLRLSFDYKETKQTSLELFKKNKTNIQQCLTKDNFTRVNQLLSSKKYDIDADLWSKLVFDVFFVFDKARLTAPSVLKALKPLYFARVTSFFKETLDLSHEESEVKIREQARVFFKNRDYLLQKYK
jgi:glucosylglycerate synthase